MPDNLSLDEFARRAEHIYYAERELRDALDEVRLVLRNDHDLDIPPDMQVRALEYKSGIGREKVDRGVTLLVDGKAPLITVATDAGGRDAQEDSDVVARWLTGARLYAANACDRDLFAAIAEDLLTDKGAYELILPAPEVWQDRPDQKLAEIIEGEIDEREAKRKARQVRQQTERFKRQRFPITSELLPPRGVILRHGRYGAAEAWVYQQKTVLDVLDFYRGADGKTRVPELEAATREERQDLTFSDYVTVVSRFTRTHMQVALLGFEIDTDEGTVGSRYHNHIVEEIFSGAHGLNRVPIAYYPARQTNSHLPQYRYNPFINRTVARLIYRYDLLQTQRMSVARMVSWPTLVYEPPPTAAGNPSKTPTIELREGGTVAIDPGGKLHNPMLTNATDMRYVSEMANDARAQIDLHTLTAAAYGTNAAESGYLQNQLVAATESTLEMPARGLQRGHEEACAIYLECAAHLLAEGHGPIPVRFVNEEGSKYVTMTERLAAYDWDVTVQVRPRPPGGEAAMTATLAQQKQQGWISDAYAMERLGIRNIERMRRQILEERVTFSGPLLDLVGEATVARMRRALQRAETPERPEQPILSEAAASVLQTPEALALLPGMGGGATGGPPTNAGMPGAVDPAPGAPTPSPATIRANNGAGRFGAPGATPGGGAPGLPAGSGQTMPGGQRRQSETDGRRPF